jgi:hypothetical protein
MFLDIHGHSVDKGIFTYAPMPDSEKDRVYVERLPKILDNLSPYFSLYNCEFQNQKKKKNCARLALYRDFNLLDSYTIESSCFGFERKDYNSTNKKYEIQQFKI